MKEILYHLNLAQADFELISITTKVSTCYLTKVTEKSSFHSDNNEIKITTYKNELFRDALSRFTFEVRKRLEEHISDICLPLHF